MPEPFYTDISASIKDTVETSLQKINRILFLNYAGGGIMPTPFYATLDASIKDSQETSLQKINQLLFLGAGGGGGGIGAVFRGSGSPEGVVTCLSGACVYVDSDTGSLWTFNGTAGANTGWI